MVTIKDVAKRAGVSVTTVSRVLNNSDHPVSAEAKARIEKAIKELGYLPNSWARHLVTKKTSIIGLLVPDLTNPYYFGIARGVEDAAHELGYVVIIGNTDRITTKTENYLKVLREKRVDGMILAGGAGSIDLSNKENTKVVLIGRDLNNEIPTIRIDNIKAAEQAMNYLIGLGHKKIAMITGLPTSTTSIDRFSGYKKVLLEAGLSYNPQYVVEGNFTAKSGYKAANYLLSLPDPPTAILAVNDLTGLGASRACIEKGLTLPDDLSIVGFDAAELMDYSFIKLTSVDIPTYEMGRSALKAVVDLINGKSIDKPIYLSTELVIGESSGPPPNSDYR